MIPELIIKTDFFGEGYTKKFYDVKIEDVELYETKKAYKDKAWYIKIRGQEFELCPPPLGLRNGADLKAKKVLEDVENQLKPKAHNKDN